MSRRVYFGARGDLALAHVGPFPVGAFVAAAQQVKQLTRSSVCVFC